MTQLSVRFAGPVRRPWAEAERRLTVDDGTTVGDLLLSLGYTETELGQLYIASNGRDIALKTVLEEGTTLDVILRVGGG